MALPFRSDSLLGKAVKDAVTASTKPSLSLEDGRRITPGQEYIFLSPENSSDGVTQVPWTRRVISVDLGAYISPTEALFESTADATGVIPTVDTYIGENGNIKQHFSETPFFGMYNVKVYNDQSQDVVARVSIATQNSIWMGVDATGVMDTIITTTPYADNSNAHTSATIPLPTGWSEIALGIYAQSGSVDFEIGGDLSVQVAKMEAPDKTPPSDVSNLAQNLTWASPHNIQITWDWPTDSPDLVGAVVYKSAIADANKIQTVLFEKEIHAQIIVSGFAPNETAALYVRTFDTEGNYSDGVSLSASSISGSLYFDAIAPETPSVPTLTTGVMADNLAKAWVKLTWSPNTDEDLARYIILKKLTADSNYWAIATVSSAANDRTFLDTTVTNGVSYDYQLMAEDTSGNRSAATAAETIVAGDVTGPADISDAYIDGVSKALNAAYSIAGQYAQFQWLNPADTDLDSIRVYVTKNSTTKASTAWSAAQANDGIYTTIPAKPSEYLTWDFYDKQALTTNSTIVPTWLFFVPVDRNGNACATNPPKYFKLTFSAVVASPVTTTLAFATECNARGWWKDDISATVGYNTTGGYTPSIGSYSYTWDGAAQSSDDITDPITKTTETTTAGSLLSARVYFNALDTNKLTYGTAAQRLVKLDKTAPTAPTSPAASNVNSGVQISWTDGADTISGLQYTQIWRNTTNATGGTLIGTVAPGTLLFIDTAQLENGRTYYYSIRHYDNADNAGTYSSVASVKIYPPEVGAHINWLDNSGFERDDPSGAETFAGWKDGGTPVAGTALFGSRAVGVSSSNTVTQEGIPLLAEYMLFSLYARSGDPAPPKIQIALSFKDLRGVEVDSHTFETVAVTDSYARYSATSGGDPFLIAPTGSSPAATYAYADAATMDVTILTDGQPADVDAVLLQEVFWDGATATSVETLETAPTTWFDSRVLNMDRINAWVGRYALLYANNMVAGNLASADGQVNFDLDNSEIVLSDTNEYINYPATVIMNQHGIKREQWNGQNFYAPFVRLFTENLSELGADADVTGEVTIIEGLQIGFGEAPLESVTTLCNAIYLVTAEYTENSTGGPAYNQRVYPIEQKANATDPGNGYAYISIERVGSTQTVDVKIIYSCYIRGDTQHAIQLNFRVGGGWYES